MQIDFIIGKLSEIEGRRKNSKSPSRIERPNQLQEKEEKLLSLNQVIRG